MHAPHLVQEAQTKLYEYYALGKMRPVIYRNYPLSELKEALGAIDSRASYGKIVLTP